MDKTFVWSKCRCAKLFFATALVATLNINHIVLVCSDLCLTFLLCRDKGQNFLGIEAPISSLEFFTDVLSKSCRFGYQFCGAFSGIP